MSAEPWSSTGLKAAVTQRCCPALDLENLLHEARAAVPSSLPFFLPPSTLFLFQPNSIVSLTIKTKILAKSQPAGKLLENDWQ